MPLPALLKDALSAIFSQTENLKTLKEDAARISRRYRDEKSKDGRRLVTTKSEAVAYALSRMPATFGAVDAVLNQLTNTFAAGDFQTLTDVGAGTGAAAWATFAHFPDLQTATCLEREPHLARTGQQLMHQAPFAGKTVWQACDITRDAIRPADIVTCAYVLNELPVSLRERVITALWHAAQKVLVLIEPATPESCLNMQETRRLLIQNGARIIAPCPHENPCPLGDDGWCHFACRVERDKIHKALKGGTAPYEDEKFSYFICSKTAPETRSARLLRHPVIRSGCVDLTLCLPDGTTCQETVSRRQKERYKAARKADWGDIFPVNG